MEKATMNIKEASEYLGVSPSTVRLWMKNNGLPALKLSIGGRLLFKQEHLDNWLDEKIGGNKEVYETYGNVKVMQP